MLEVFAGASGSGASASLTFTSTSGTLEVKKLGGGSLTLAGQDSFGFYMKSQAGQLFHSRPGDNAAALSGQDHMVTLKGVDGLKLRSNGTTVDWNSGTYVLAWEDLPFSGSDRDYQDMVLHVSGVTPVPEASTYIAIGLLALPIGINALRLLRKNRS
jgi:hypothetical protein